MAHTAWPVDRCKICHYVRLREKLQEIALRLVGSFNPSKLSSFDDAGKL